MLTHRVLSGRLRPVTLSCFRRPNGVEVLAQWSVAGLHGFTKWVRCISLQIEPNPFCFCIPSQVLLLLLLRTCRLYFVRIGVMLYKSNPNSCMRLLPVFSTPRHCCCYYYHSIGGGGRCCAGQVRHVHRWRLRRAGQ